MSGATSIHWTDSVWNPTRGCSVISEGCHMGDLYANHAPKDRKGGDHEEWPADLRVREMPR